MKIEPIEVCTDCAVYLTNGDLSHVDDKQEQGILKGEKRLLGLGQCNRIAYQGDTINDSIGYCDCCRHQVINRITFNLIKP